MVDPTPSSSTRSSKPKIAVFSEASATITNSAPLVTSRLSPRVISLSVARCFGGCAELERAGGEDDYANRNRNGARQRGQLHLDRRQGDTQRKGGHSEHGPHKEVPRAHYRGQATEARLALCCRWPGSSHSIGTREAASSPPSSRSTWRGTTQRLWPMFVRASASTSSTSSSRPASLNPRCEPLFTCPGLVCSHRLSPFVGCLCSSFCSRYVMINLAPRVAMV
jgi:hypothetical protein